MYFWVECEHESDGIFHVCVADVTQTLSDDSGFHLYLGGQEDPEWVTVVGTSPDYSSEEQQDSIRAVKEQLGL